MTVCVQRCVCTDNDVEDIGVQAGLSQLLEWWVPVEIFKRSFIFSKGHLLSIGAAGTW